MLYLLDANVLIDANRDYYPLDRIPEFWDWLLHHGEEGNVSVPREVWEELREGDDGLTDWVNGPEFGNHLLFGEDADPAIVSRVIDQGYAPDLSDEEVEQLGRDPFLIAYGLVDIAERCVVTTERSRPGRARARRHVPDVCDHFGIQSLNAFEFTRALDFRTNWQHG